jgi:urea transporter
MYALPLWLIALGAILTGTAPPALCTNGANLDINYPLLLGVSFEDIASSVMAFLCAALAIGLGIDRAEPARRVVTSPGLVGAAAILVDRFV